MKATYRNSCKAGRHISIKTEMESLSCLITNIYTPNIQGKRNFFFKNLKHTFKAILTTFKEETSTWLKIY